MRTFDPPLVEPDSEHGRGIRCSRRREQLAIFLFSICFLYFSYAGVMTDHGGLSEAQAAFYSWATYAGAVVSLFAFGYWIRIRFQKIEILKDSDAVP